MDLSSFENSGFSRGASLVKQALWHFLGRPLVESQLFFHSDLKVAVLRAFGGKIGSGVRIKPGVRIKFPWRLAVGDHSWIGEDVWIDNLAEVRIGSNCCISQGAYLCTGSHDWSRSTFDLLTKPIVIEDRAWVAAYAVVGPGVKVEEGAVLALGSVAVSSLGAWSIFQGNPAVETGKRPR